MIIAIFTKCRCYQHIHFSNRLPKRRIFFTHTNTQFTHLQRTVKMYYKQYALLTQ